MCPQNDKPPRRLYCKHIQRHLRPNLYATTTPPASFARREQIGIGRAGSPILEHPGMGMTCCGTKSEVRICTRLPAHSETNNRERPAATPQGPDEFGKQIRWQEELAAGGWAIGHAWIDGHSLLAPRHALNSPTRLTATMPRRARTGSPQLNLRSDGRRLWSAYGSNCPALLKTACSAIGAIQLRRDARLRRRLWVTSSTIPQ